MGETKLSSEVFIVDGSRTAIGSTFKALKSFTASQLAAFVIKDIVQKNKIPKELVDYVILGNTVSAGQGQNMARQAALLAKLPSFIPAFSVNEVCASGLQSVLLGAQAIMCKEARMVVAGGAESASQSPFVIRREDTDKSNLIDSLIFDGLICQLTGKHMGDLAEALAVQFGISRLEQDKHALESHIRACRAKESGKFLNEIVSVETKDGIFKEDQRPRRNINLERLGNLPPAFKKDGTVTAGNSCIPSDAAAILLLASSEALREAKIKPKARILGYSSAFVDPAMFLTAIAPSVKACLKKCNLSLKDIDLFEIGEAFSVQSVLTQKELGVPANKVNIFGGDVALGHPLGAAGSRILVTLLHALIGQKKKKGLAAMCLGGGGAIAIAVEILE